MKKDRNGWKISLYRVVPMDDPNSDFGESMDGLRTLLEGLESKREMYMTTNRHRTRHNGDQSHTNHNTYADRGVGLSETTGRTLPWAREAAETAGRPVLRWRWTNWWGNRLRSARYACCMPDDRGYWLTDP